MPKFKVRLTQTVNEEAYLYVTAKNQERAEEKALNIARDGNEDLQWQFFATEGDIEATATPSV